MINLQNPAFPDRNNYCNTKLYIATALETQEQAKKKNCLKLLYT